MTLGLWQTGKTNKKVDLKYEALKPGWRETEWGTKYYENRANRSDLNPKKKI